MTVLHVDFETRSACDLLKAGAHIYAADPTTGVWCMAWAFDEEDPEIWVPGDDLPDRVEEHILSGGIMMAHNAAFERAIWREIMTKRYGWPEPKIEQWRCTMAMAFALALPGSLENASSVTRCPVEKDMEGNRVMMRMAKPRTKIVCHECDGNATTFGLICGTCGGSGVLTLWWDDLPRRERLYAYCKQDIVVERYLDKRVLPLRPSEQEVWRLDQEINDRGVYIDADLCYRAIDIVKEMQGRLNAEMKNVTKGDIRNTGEVSRIVSWLQDRGLPVKSLRAEEIDLMLALWDLEPDQRRVLELRREASKTSTSKIKAMLERRGPDGRMRGNLQYHGAGTGRWAGRGAQVQNYPRPRPDADIEAQVAAILHGADISWITQKYGPPLTVISDCLRSMICAAPGNDLLAADFSSIEARVIAWSAGQANVLAAFRQNTDVYCIAASDIYRRKITEKDKTERSVGKVAVLALGYQGGAEAFGKMASGYRVKLAPLYDSVFDAATPENREKALAGWKQRGVGKSKLDEESWMAAELIKLAWRTANPAIVSYWRDLEDAAIAAVRDGGVHRVGNTLYKVKGSFLFCRLPSGRAIAYPFPRIEEKETPWGSKVEQVIYKGTDSFTHKWGDQQFYGGLAAENITQAIARDIMVEAMLRVDAAGYKPVMTIHDEIVCESPKGFGSYEEFERLMVVVPDWAEGCPISAGGWRGDRYRK